MSIYRKKILLIWVPVAIVLVVIILGGIAGYQYWLGISNDTRIEQVGEVKLKPGNDIRLGQPATAVATFKCPWHRYPVSAEVSSGKGAQLVTAPTIKREKLRFGYSLWTVTAKIQPYRTGEIGKSKLEVVFNQRPDTKNDLRMSLNIPGFKATPLETESLELKVAGSLVLEKETSTLHIILIIGIITTLIVIGVIIFILIKKRRIEQGLIMHPWAVALLELAELRENLRKHKVAGEICCARLTDVVRGYLEKRFSLRAPTQTTEEFLHDLNRSGSPLQENHRFFLSEFMTAAEMVKFANVPADLETLNEALDKAEQLVDETKPEEKKK